MSTQYNFHQQSSSDVPSTRSKVRVTDVLSRINEEKKSEKDIESISLKCNHPLLTFNNYFSLNTYNYRNKKRGSSDYLNDDIKLIIKKDLIKRYYLY